MPCAVKVIKEIYRGKISTQFLDEWKNTEDHLKH